MEPTVNLAIIQTGQLFVRLLALFGLAIIGIFLYNFLKPHILTIMMFPAVLAAPLLVLMIWLMNRQIYQVGNVIALGALFSSLVGFLIFKFYEYVLKGSAKPGHRVFIIVAGIIGIVIFFVALNYMQIFNLIEWVGVVFRKVYEWFGIFPPEGGRPTPSPSRPPFPVRP